MKARSQYWWSILCVVAALIVIAGWAELRFVCDDAYIAFRYARNLASGWGATWNPPPFAPVEGYTSPLWVAILAGAYALGLSLPNTANALSLAATIGAALVAIAWLRRFTPSRPDPLGCVALFGVVTNRTFLTWSSSGLETGAFNLLIAVWAFTATGQRVRPLRLGLIASALALTRPDGLLYAVSTAVLLWSTTVRRERVLGALALSPIAAHLVWRHATYGRWLPNTYYAKVSAFWPEAGLRYLGCFVIEHGLWFGGTLLVLAALASLGSGLRVRKPIGAETSVLVVAATMVAHVGYYIIVVGGDHFEYRVLSHTVVPTYIGMYAFSRGLSSRLRWTVLLGTVMASWPIAWTHHSMSQEHTTRQQTEALFIPVAKALPAAFSPLAQTHDGWQAWLIERYVCRRHQEHKVFANHLLRTLAQPPELSRLHWKEGRPISSARSVGVVGWRFSEAAIIDELGLNDAVIAEGPLRHRDGSKRRMAHERMPPRGYLECFRQNLMRDAKGILVDPSVDPMTDAEIRECETRDWSP